MGFRQRAYVDPLDQQPVKARPAQTQSEAIDENVPQVTEFREGGSGGNNRYRPSNALVMGGTPVGAAGVKQYHEFPRVMSFHLDDEPKPVPLPPVTQAVRRSVFQRLQQARYQFHINPAWGRQNGRYPRFSFINLIAQTPDDAQALGVANAEQKLHGVEGQRPRQRFTKVLFNPRNITTPETYGTDGGYSP